MNNNIIQNQNQEKRDEIKIGNTVYIINNVFQDKTSIDNAWLAIIARAESTRNN